MNFSANIRGAEKTGPEEVLGGPQHSGPANTLTIEDAMAASILRLEQENQELRAEVALLREEQKILAKGHQGHAKAAVTEGGTGFSGAERPEPSPHLRIGGREMNDRPTPETEAAVIASNGQWSYVLRETCERLERERDEARAIVESYRDAACRESCRDKEAADRIGGNRWSNI